MVCRLVARMMEEALLQMPSDVNRCVTVVQEMEVHDGQQGTKHEVHD
jgi:hypothetical protein